MLSIFSVCWIARVSLDRNWGLLQFCCCGLIRVWSDYRLGNPSDCCPYELDLSRKWSCGFGGVGLSIWTLRLPRIMGNIVFSEHGRRLHITWVIRDLRNPNFRGRGFLGFCCLRRAWSFSWGWIWYWALLTRKSWCYWHTRQHRGLDWSGPLSFLKIPFGLI